MSNRNNNRTYYFILLIAVLLLLSACHQQEGNEHDVISVPSDSPSPVSSATQTENEPTKENNNDDADESGQSYVLDFYGLLSSSEEEVLTDRAREISEKYDCSVHIGVINDMAEYGYEDIESCAEDFFRTHNLGKGDNNTGILLLLSMEGRDYDIDAHGEFAHYAFTDYGKTTISDAFLDNFKENDWFGGFFDYLNRCEELLNSAEHGNPV